MNRKAGPFFRNSLGITPWFFVCQTDSEAFGVVFGLLGKKNINPNWNPILPRTGRSSQKWSNTCLVFVNTATPCSIMVKFTLWQLNIATTTMFNGKSTHGPEGSCPQKTSNINILQWTHSPTIRQILPRFPTTETCGRDFQGVTPQPPPPVTFERDLHWPSLTRRLGRQSWN